MNTNKLMRNPTKRSFAARASCVLFAALLLLLPGCSAPAGGSNSAPEYAMETTVAAAATTMPATMPQTQLVAMNYDMNEELDWDDASGGGGGAYADDGQARVRKEIKNVNCRLLVKDVMATYNSVAGIVNSLGGYEFSKSESRRGESIYLNITIKLPPENLEEFERQLRSSTGDNAISHYNMFSDDITSMYYDTASRLESMRASMEQYMALIERARNVSDMLEIRREITYLQADIDSLQGQINMWNMLVGYATIDMAIERESDPLAQTRSQQWSFNTPSEIFNAMGNGFIATGNAVYQFIIGLFVIIVSLVPVLVPAGIILLIVLRINKKRKAKKEKDGGPAPARRGKYTKTPLPQIGTPGSQGEMPKLMDDANSQTNDEAAPDTEDSDVNNDTPPTDPAE
ncbi:MAG: DUF4349 domain-containing protein [Oscillospiraceae bacterium]|nr:DUF4349 domain-containing protein [Oscillospiraceae bacterium]